MISWLVIATNGVNPPINLQDVPKIITAIGGLGTAAFGLVDATKAFWGGVNHIGFRGIKKTVQTLTPGSPTNGLSQQKILATLKANWFNGTDLSSQKAIAKSLIKLNLSAANAPALADATGVDRKTLADVATSIAAGITLTAPQTDLYGRFDLTVTALLDETYQRSDDVYRNWTRFWAWIVSMVLAVAGGWILNGSWNWSMVPECLLVGSLATPLAPIAKDLSTALATAVNTMQAVKKAS